MRKPPKDKCGRGEHTVLSDDLTHSRQLAKRTSTYQGLISLPAWACVTLVAVVTFVTCLPILQNQYVWDDRGTILENEEIATLSLETVRWAFTTHMMGHYQPITWLALAAVFDFSGLEPMGYHLLSLGLHSLNAVLLLLLCHQLATRSYAIPEIHAHRSQWPSAAVGTLFFSLHPLRVENVAWISDTGTLLAAGFLMVSAIAYFRANDFQSSGRRRGWWHTAAFVSFLVSMLSKGWGMTYPVVLILWDLYPLRLWGSDRKLDALFRSGFSKLPYFLVSGGFAAKTLTAKRDLAMTMVEDHTLSDRLVQALYGASQYPWKTLYPDDLSPLYLLRYDLDPWQMYYLVGAVGTLVLCGIAFWQARSRPWIPSVWFSYLVVVFPALGLLQSGEQLMADRYTYISCLPLAVLLAIGFSRWNSGVLQGTFPRPPPWARAWILVLIGAWLVILAVMSFRQSRIWKDNESLWSYVTSVDPTNYTALNNLGYAHEQNGEVDRAWELYTAAIFQNPRYEKALVNRANLLEGKGRLNGALMDYDRALAINPEYAKGYNNRGNIHMTQGDLEAARRDFDRSIELDPSSAKAFYNRGNLHLHMVNLEQAERDYGTALQLDPHYANVYGNRGVLRRRKGDIGGAIGDFRRALEVADGNWTNRGSVERFLKETLAGER